ncbi:MAG: hypothetical protein J4F48_08530 [Nitrospinae bacterium]|nr:hypothetical protein [Nitrospinota bacterium]
MSRLAPLEPESMPPRQREAYEDLIANQRGGVRGPFGVWVRSPGLVIALRRLMKFYYEESVITEDIRELAIIITTRHMGAAYAYSAHEAQALASGLTPALVAAVMTGETPTEGTDLELCVYRYCTELLETKKASDAAYQEAFTLLGEKGVVDLTALVGFYTAISLTLNAFEIPPVT